jgi:hypothetical protein
VSAYNVPDSEAVRITEDWLGDIGAVVAISEGKPNERDRDKGIARLWVLLPFQFCTFEVSLSASHSLFRHSRAELTP